MNLSNQSQSSRISTDYTRRRSRSRSPQKRINSSAYNNQIDDKKYNKYDKNKYKFEDDRQQIKSNQNFKIGSGPIIFKGTPGAQLKASSTPLRESIIDKVTEQMPPPKKKIQKNQNDNEYAAFEWEEFDREADETWYDNEEGDYFHRDDENPFIGDQEKYKVMEKQMENHRAGLKGLKQMEKSAENEKWEVQRMMYSGVFKINHLQQDLNEVDENRVLLMVHDIQPPFLNGKTAFTTQMGMVSVVRDPTSDMAILAKKGSKVLKEIRERNDKTKMRERFWELAGSKLGNLLKIQKEEEVTDTTEFNQQGDVDYKSGNQFSAALSKKNEAVSDFARQIIKIQKKIFL